MTMRVALTMALVCGLGVAAERMAEAQKWSEGVSDKQKSDAKKALDEGNSLYLNGDYREARLKYEEALKSWNHPAIRFNLVRCLVQLGDSVEANKNLDDSLVYGKAPFDDSVYQEVLSYQKMLASQTGSITVDCKEPGAVLKFDGQIVVEKCPGAVTKKVALGEHSVIATKDGFLTKEMPVIVLGGKPQSVDVKLVPLDQAAKVVHRWPQWMPWVVFGSGLAVTGLGVLLELDAQDQMDRYDSLVRDKCMTSGCDLEEKNAMGAYVHQDLRDQKASAESRDRLAIGVMSVGAVGAAVGGVLLFMNRGKTVYEDPTGKGGNTAVRVTPTRDGGGFVTLSGRF